MPNTPNTNENENRRLQEMEAEIVELKAQLAAKEEATQNAMQQKIGFFKWLMSLWIGEEVKQSFRQFFEELPTPSKATSADFAASIVRRFTRIGTFSIIIAITPFLLLSVQIWILIEQDEKMGIQNQKIEVQNNLVKTQNDKIEAQNEKIDKQIYLEEASRRNNLVFLMDNILNQVNVELNDKENGNATPYIHELKNAKLGIT